VENGKMLKMMLVFPDFPPI